MRKYTRTESTPEVISPESHKAIDSELDKLSKESARDLSVSQRNQLRLAVDKAEEDASVDHGDRA